VIGLVRSFPESPLLLDFFKIGYLKEKYKGFLSRRSITLFIILSFFFPLLYALPTQVG